MKSETIKQKCGCGAVWCYLDGYNVKPPVVCRPVPAIVTPVMSSIVVLPPTPIVHVVTEDVAPSDDSEEHTSGNIPNEESRDLAKCVASRSPQVEPTLEHVPSDVEPKRVAEVEGNGLIVTLSENRCLESVDSNGVRDAKIDEIVEVGMDGHPDASDAPEGVIGVSVTKRRSPNPWSGYARPGTMTQVTKVEYSDPTEPLPARARAERTHPVRKLVSIPSYVKEAKIAEQNGRCIYCDRCFGSAVIHLGRVEILEPHSEHFKPRAASGRTSDANISYACHVCNVLKSDFLFDTVEDVRQFLVNEWSRKQYANCPLLIPFKRDRTVHAGTYN